LFASAERSAESVQPEPKATAAPVPRRGPLSIQRIAPNVLQIDYCDLKIGGKTLEHQYFYNAADLAFKHHGFEQGNPWSTAVQFKTAILDRNRFPADSGFEAAFHFSVDAGVNRRGMRAVVERPPLWKVAVNGHSVSALKGEWWVDRDFGVYDIGPHVVNGANTITVTAQPMSVHAELEPMYIVGDFHVAPQPSGWKLVAGSLLTIGAWNSQGLPFYPDWVGYSATYRIAKPGARYQVQLGKWSGTVVEVRVNGTYAGIIGWQPYALDVSRWIRGGENQVEVRVCGSLKNTFGPHHGKVVKGLAAPQLVRNAPAAPPPGSAYNLDSYGLLEDFTLIEMRSR
jgi:hypothetical protein